jgi:signal transduction histidine kinase
MLCLAAIMTERRRATMELVQSRARIATAATEERMRLEKELHDSTQNRLVGLQIRLRLVREQAEETAPEIAAALEQVLRDSEVLNEALRRVGHGISPPLLATRGLVDALRSESAHSAVAVRVVANDVGRGAPATETAVYLCCVASIQNAAEHAGDGAAVTVVLRRDGNELVFSVQGSGHASAPTAAPADAGITELQDRIETIGGRVEITAAPGRGTTVAGVVPWPRRLTEAGAARPPQAGQYLARQVRSPPH